MTARDELIDYLAKNASAADCEKYGPYVSPDEIREATDMVDAAIKEAVQPAEAELAENTSVMQALRRQRDQAEAQIAVVRAYADSLYSAERKIDACGVREKLYELLPMAPAEGAPQRYTAGDFLRSPKTGETPTLSSEFDADIDLPELTAEDAVEAMQDMAGDLYKAEDRLAFIAEMCDAADREQRQVTTEQIRAWANYTGCGGVIVLPETDEHPAGIAIPPGSPDGRHGWAGESERLPDGTCPDWCPCHRFKEHP